MCHPSSKHQVTLTCIVTRSCIHHLHTLCWHPHEMCMPYTHQSSHGSPHKRRIWCPYNNEFKVNMLHFKLLFAINEKIKIWIFVDHESGQGWAQDLEISPSDALDWFWRTIGRIRWFESVVKDHDVCRSTSLCSWALYPISLVCFPSALSLSLSLPRSSMWFRR